MRPPPNSWKLTIAVMRKTGMARMRHWQKMPFIDSRNNVNEQLYFTKRIIRKIKKIKKYKI